MHANIVLAAIFAGSQIAAAAFVRPHNFAFQEMPKHGGSWFGNGKFGWGPGGWHGEHERHGHGHGHGRPGNAGGFIGAHPKPSDGFIGKHRGHGSPNAPGRPNGGSSPTTVTVTVTVTNPGASTSTAPSPSERPTGSRPSSGTQPTSSSAPENNPSKGRNPPSGGATPSPGGSFQSQVLQWHNVHRANHSASALTWSSDLASIAETIAKSCVFEHNLTPGGGGYGQNIAAGSPPSDIDKVVSNEFYNGEVNDFAGLYGEANPSMANFEQWGHFTQLVWKNTQTVGCATVQCPGGVGMTQGNVQPFFTVCNYKPPGNVAGEYAKNVGRPLGHPSVVA